MLLFLRAKYNLKFITDDYQYLSKALAANIGRTLVQDYIEGIKLYN